MYGPRVLFRLDPFLTLSGDFQGPCTRGVYYSDLTTLPRSSEIYCLDHVQIYIVLINVETII